MITIKTTKWISLFFFSIGTVLLILQLTNKGLNYITVVGFYYVLLSTLINLVIVGYYLINTIYPDKRITSFKCIGILCINIPIAFFYFYLITYSI